VLTGTGSSASGGGNVLVITVNISFAAGFTGPQKVYLFAQEGTYGTVGLNSGIQEVASWTIPR
jgi:hypothetical protein